MPEIPLSLEEVRRVPKVLLHDHLDGGLRPATLVQLAGAAGYGGLPTTDPEELARWLVARASRGCLPAYLEGFGHTVAVMQTAEALRRVGRECVEDLAADGVIYAEVRFAPELHTERGLSMAAATEAVLEGLDEGAAAAACSARPDEGAAAAALAGAGDEGRGPAAVAGASQRRRPFLARLILSALRDRARSLEVAKTALAFRRAGVVGFDLTGPERGHAASAHREAFEHARRGGLHVTAHAGEAAGPESVAEVLYLCHVERVGHGVSIADDIEGGGAGSGAHLGPLASYVRTQRVPLEICPTSNVQTGAAGSISEHPVGLLYRLGFAVTLNTDNRLMSGVSLSSELAACAEAFGWGWPDLLRLSLDAVESAFCEPAERRGLRAEVAHRYASLEKSNIGPRW